jgi:hypothetical protein
VLAVGRRRFVVATVHRPWRTLRWVTGVVLLCLGLQVSVPSCSTATGQRRGVRLVCGDRSRGPVRVLRRVDVVREGRPRDHVARDRRERRRPAPPRHREAGDGSRRTLPTSPRRPGRTSRCSRSTSRPSPSSAPSTSPRATVTSSAPAPSSSIPWAGSPTSMPTGSTPSGWSGPTSTRSSSAAGSARTGGFSPRRCADRFGRFAYVATSGWWARIEKMAIGHEPPLLTRRVGGYTTTGGWGAHLAADVAGDGRASCSPTTPRTGPGGGSASSPRAGRAAGAGGDVRPCHRLGGAPGRRRDPRRPDRPALLPRIHRIVVVEQPIVERHLRAREALGDLHDHGRLGCALAADVTGNGRVDLLSYHPSNGTWWITPRATGSARGSAPATVGGVTLRRTGPVAQLVRALDS